MQVSVELLIIGAIELFSRRQSQLAEAMKGLVLGANNTKPLLRLLRNKLRIKALTSRNNASNRLTYAEPMQHSGHASGAHQHSLYDIGPRHESLGVEILG
ncbi:MAG: hypothetical protein Q7Q73_08470 [Verrucomicrobiota bacterium JB024]|nr:hypothetical protein [Verrucomicrobiota bacterium JB024]